MSSSSDNKLIGTAIGAAIAGAAMAIAALKLSERNSAAKNAMATPPPGKVSTYIFEDSERQDRRRSSSMETMVFPHNHEEKMRRQIMARAAIEEDNVMPRDSVTVRVPATSANMGPGCECLINEYLWETGRAMQHII